MSEASPQRLLSKCLLDGEAYEVTTMSLRKYLRKLTHVTLADIWDVAFKPAILYRKLTAPPIISGADALPLLFPQTATELIQTYRQEFINDHKFFDEFYRKTTKVRSRRPDLSGKEFLYVLIRIAKPRIVVETGVFDGHSSAVILQALNDNKSGSLISIDLPATATIIGSTDGMKETKLPPDCIPGWSIPDYLRDRHNLILGDSKEILPELVAQYSPIDIFIHDSLHTYEHMYFEYKTAWPNLSDGGFLLSDDIHWNHAFHEFCRGQRRSYLNLGELGVVMK